MFSVTSERKRKPGRHEAIKGEERNQHRDAAAIGGVGFRTEFLAEETFFETRFDPKAYNNKKRADKCVEASF